MPLDFAPLEIPYGQLDTHTDPTAMEPGTLTKAENLSSDVDGRYSKRFGYEIKGFALSSDGGVRLAKRGKELLAYDKNSQWKYVSEADQWFINSYHPPRATPSEQNVALEQSKFFYRSSRATADGMVVHAYIDSASGDLNLLAYSDVDGSLITSTSDTSNDYEIVHAVSLGSVVVVFYSSVTSQVIRYKTFTPATLTWGTSTTYQSGSNVFAGTVSYPYAPFDIVAVSSTDVCLAWATDSPEIKVIRRNVIANTNTYAAVTLAAEEPDGGFAIGVESATHGAVSFHSASAAAVRLRGFNPTTGATLYALTTVQTDAAAPAMTNFNIGLCGGGTSEMVLCLDRHKVSPLVGYSAIYRYSSLGAQTDSVITFNCWLASKPWGYNNKFYIAVLSPFSTQGTYFVLDITTSFYGERVPVAMLAYRTAYEGGLAIAGLPDVDNPSTGVFAFDAPTAYKFLSQNAPAVAATSFELDFEDPLRFQNTEVGDDVFFTGGVTFKYDGRDVAESNFLLYPEIFSATPGAVGGGGLDNGVYSYIVIYEITDRNGNVDRSTTSLPATATTVAGAGLGKVDLVISQYNRTHYINNNQTVVASIFRTEVNGETYYHVASVALTPTLADTVSYSDHTPDATIISNRIIYTQGGVLDREPALPCGQLVQHGNRLWGFRNKTVFYSGDYVPGENPWFSSLQQFVIDQGGDIVALASLDGKLVIFKRDRIFKVSGEGMNAQGVGATLTPPELITSDCGCIERRSVVVIPQGIMFQSSKGLYMLTRGEELTFIGMPVSSYLEDMPTITAATMMPNTREVRFQLSDGVDRGYVLVYNYRDNRWTTHTNAQIVPDPTAPDVFYTNRVDGLVVDGSYYTLDTSATISRETEGAFLDPDDTFVVSEIETGWIKPAGKQGLARVQRATFLNEFMDPHNLEIEIQKDYVDSSVQSVTFASSEIASFPEEQVSMHIQNQQGEAWRIRNRDAASDDTDTGEGFRAKGITFLVGAKRGTVEKIMQAGAKA